MRPAPPFAALVLAASLAAPAAAGAAPVSENHALLALAAAPEAHAAVVIPSTHAPALSSAPTGARGTGGTGQGDPGAGGSDPGASGHQTNPGAPDLIADADPTHDGRGTTSGPSATLPSVRRAEHAPPTIADPPPSALPRTGFDDWLVALTGAGLLLTGTGLRLRISPRSATPTPAR